MHNNNLKCVFRDWADYLYLNKRRFKNDLFLRAEDCKNKYVDEKQRPQGLIPT
jgi:hypothetical protein